MATTTTISGNGQPQAALITLTTANTTEGSVQFRNVTSFRFKDRLNTSVIRYSFLPSIVVTGTASGVATLPAGTTYQSPTFDMNGGKRSFMMYFASPGTAVDVEIEAI